MPKDALMRPATTLVGAGATVDSTLLGGASGALNTVLDMGGAPVVLESEVRVGGALAGTGPSLTVKWQESATGTGSWTDIAGGAHAAISASQQSAVGLGGGGPTGGSLDPSRITFRTTKRFIRAFATLANADNTIGGVTLGLNPVEVQPTSGHQ